MGFAIRWKESEEAARREYPLADEYTIEEIQQQINFAIEHGGEVALVRKNGRPLRFKPGDVKLLSVVEMGEV